MQKEEEKEDRDNAMMEVHCKKWSGLGLGLEEDNRRKGL